MNETLALNPLLDGFNVRAPRLEDAQAIAAVINAEDKQEGGREETTVDDVTYDWQRSSIDLAQDAWVACTPTGEIVGYECIFIVHENGHFDIDGYVHPAYKNKGIGTHLLRRVEARVRQRVGEIAPAARVWTEANTYGSNTLSRQLFEAEGYALARQFWRMEIDLDAPPADPAWPEGITIRTAVVGQDDFAIYQTVQASFTDHWGFAPFSYESWRLGRFDAAFFDPSLWFLAMDGSTIAGIALCRVRSDQSGWINTVGVRREYRRRGIASTLLRHAFGEFYTRGQHNIGLGVDAQSLTGATHVYEGVGMHVMHHYNTYQKTLREGEQAEAYISPALSD